MTDEIWRDIRGFEGLYQISNYGRVKRIEHTRVHPKNGVRKYDERILHVYRCGSQQYPSYKLRLCGLGMYEHRDVSIMTLLRENFSYDEVKYEHKDHFRGKVWDID